jgi:hypothetical protein
MLFGKDSIKWASGLCAKCWLQNHPIKSELASIFFLDKEKIRGRQQTGAAQHIFVVAQNSLCEENKLSSCQK